MVISALTVLASGFGPALVQKSPVFLEMLAGLGQVVDAQLLGV
jgi:hypothetical protein